MVRFVSGKVTVVSPEWWSVRTGGGAVATRKQLPLKLAWAMSIHKSQVQAALVCMCVCVCVCVCACMHQVQCVCKDLRTHTHTYLFILHLFLQSVEVGNHGIHTYVQVVSSRRETHMRVS